MSAKKYDCPACGKAMVKDLDTWECESCLFLDREKIVEAIEARTLARIAEAEKPLVEALKKAVDRTWSGPMPGCVRDWLFDLINSAENRNARATERGAK